MLPEDLDAVTASYHRCMFGGIFTDTFYDRFLSKSPEVAQKFRHTDFVYQKLMLRQSLLMMILFNQQGFGAVEEMEELAERHSRRGVDIPPHLYDLWLDALCESVDACDPSATPVLLHQWRAAMQTGIDFIVARYE